MNDPALCVLKWLDNLMNTTLTTWRSRAFRQTSVLSRLMFVATLFASVCPAELGAAQAAKDVASQMAIGEVVLVPSPCPLKNDCLQVKWNMPVKLQNESRAGFLVTGRLTCDSGQLNTPDVTINDSSARSHQFNFFHSCSGEIKSADVSVSFFERGVNNDVVIVSTASKTQGFNSSSSEPTSRSLW